MFKYGKVQLKRNVEARLFRDLRDLVKNSERHPKSNGKPLKCVKQDMSFLSAMCQAEDFFPKCQQSESTPDWL